MTCYRVNQSSIPPVPAGWCVNHRVWTTMFTGSPDTATEVWNSQGCLVLLTKQGIAGLSWCLHSEWMLTERSRGRVLALCCWCRSWSQRSRDLNAWRRGALPFRAAPITALEIQVYQAKNWRGEGSSPFLRLSIDSAYNCMIFCMETRIINRKIQFPAKLHRLQLPLESSLCTFFEWST